MRRYKFLLFRVYRFRDTAAYGQLYDAYFGRIRRYIYFKVPRGEDADELASEVFLRGWEYTTSSLVENPGALFYRIARNLVADFYRDRKLEEGIGDHEKDMVNMPQIAKEIDKENEFAELMSAMQALKDEYKDILIMKYLDEMSIKEIAQVLEKTSNNVRVLLHRAKTALRKEQEK